FFLFKLLCNLIDLSWSFMKELEAIIDVKELIKNYGTFPVFDGLSLTINKGSCTGLIREFILFEGKIRGTTLYQYSHDIILSC
ncbi:unnamed protein product, partial [marine sediment metagenome]